MTYSIPVYKYFKNNIIGLILGNWWSQKIEMVVTKAAKTSVIVLSCPKPKTTSDGKKAVDANTYIILLKI